MWNLLVASSLCMASCAPVPPQAKVEPKTVSLGGKNVVDDYWWLRDKSNRQVIAYLNAENAYAARLMKPTERLQERLFEEMSDRFPSVNETVPYREGEWWYSVRNQEDRDYPIYLRRPVSATSTPQVVMDVNKLAEGHAFFEYHTGSVSDNGNLLAFATDITGNRQYVLRVKDLRDDHLLPDSMDRVDSFEWAADNKTLYYVKEDDAKRQPPVSARAGCAHVGR